MLKNLHVRKIVQALAIVVFGFILLNLTFLFDWLFQNMIFNIIRCITPVNLQAIYPWFSPILHFSFVIVIGLISWMIFKSKLAPIYKAIFLTVPTAVVFVTIGMFLYLWPVISNSLGILIGLTTLYYFKRSKQPWLYYFSVILVGLALVIMNLTGAEI